MKYKIGDYVRTKNYGIRKIFKLSDPYIYCDYGCFIEGEIAKSSPNIIDLIEVGDYVNGYLVTDFELTYFNGTYRRIEPKRIAVKIDNVEYDFRNSIKSKDIKSIVTKEQFKKMEYKVKE